MDVGGSSGSLGLLVYPVLGIPRVPWGCLYIRPGRFPGLSGVACIFGIRAFGLLGLPGFACIFGIGISRASRVACIFGIGMFGLGDPGAP